MNQTNGGVFRFLQTARERFAGLSGRIRIGQICRDRLDPLYGAVSARNIDHSEASLYKLLGRGCTNSGAGAGQDSDGTHEDS